MSTSNAPPPAPSSKKYFRMMSYVRPYWRKALYFLACSIGFGGLTGVQFFLLNDFLKSIIDPRVGPGPARDLLFVVVVAAMSSFLVLGYFEYRRLFLSRWLAAAVVRDVNNQLMDHLIGLSMSYFDNRRSGDLISRVNYDSRALEVAVTTLTTLIRDPITMLFLVVTAFVLDWRLALIGFVGFPIGALGLRPLFRRIRRSSKKSRERTGERTDDMTQILGGMRIVKAYGMEEREKEIYHELNSRIFRSDIKRVSARAKSRPLMHILNGIGMVAVVALGGKYVIDGELEAHTLFTFLAVLGSLYRPVKSLTMAANNFNDALPGVERIFEILDEKSGITDAPDAIEIDGFHDGIRFDHVSFTYGREPVLEDVCLEVKAGETIALVGHSGAGKSTLASLIGRFYEPSEGVITIDGVDQRKVKQRSLLAQIAVVTQEPYLFNSSIRENILYGRPGASDADVEAAARAANIHDEILKLPQGYDTSAGERGVQLSGGQRQRVAVARAVLRNSPILILDEATSSLDAESEQLVQDAIDRLVEGRTSFVIAHRLSTIRHADRIVVLSEGRIEAIAAHDELMDSCATYRRLWQIQEGRMELIRDHVAD